METQNLNSQLKKMKELLKASKTSISNKNKIEKIAKSPNEFGYKMSHIINALEIGLSLKAGGKIVSDSTMNFNGKSGTVTFFKNYVVPMYSIRKF